MGNSENGETAKIILNIVPEFIKRFTKGYKINATSVKKSMLCAAFRGGGPLAKKAFISLASIPAPLSFKALEKGF